MNGCLYFSKSLLQSYSSVLCRSQLLRPVTRALSTSTVTCRATDRAEENHQADTRKDHKCDGSVDEVATKITQHTEVRTERVESMDEEYVARATYKDFSKVKVVLKGYPEHNQQAGRKRRNSKKDGDYYNVFPTEQAGG